MTAADVSDPFVALPKAYETMHGYEFCSYWIAKGNVGLPPLPTCVVHSNEAARPGYDTRSATEYLDSKAVLAAKIDMMLSKWMDAATQHAVVYTGAGISTSAGIGDYASKAAGSLVVAKDNRNRKTLPPTYAHRALAAMEQQTGKVHHWLQQNHDGLAQKAGFPFAKLNEIHGSWFDKHNPVLGMQDSLRPDLLEWMIEWRDQCDFCVALGSSLCGMNADSVAEACGKRHKAAFIGRSVPSDTTETAAAEPSSSRTDGQGLVIVSLQQTRMDDLACIRIFAKIDDVMALVAKRLRLKVDTTTVHDVPMRPAPKFRRTSTK